MEERKSSPSCSSSTLKGASVFALRISLVRFTCKEGDKRISHNMSPPSFALSQANISQILTFVRMEGRRQDARKEISEYLTICPHRVSHLAKQTSHKS